MPDLAETIRKELAALSRPAQERDTTVSESAQPAVLPSPLGRTVKQQLTIRIDADVLAWLKQGGKGYQSRLNDILRTAMLAQMRGQTRD